MKKYVSFVLCVLIITLGFTCAYAQPQGYADTVINKIESIEQLEGYMDGHAYFTDVNNDGTDEVILIHYEGVPYYVSLNSYAPQYYLSENEICSEEAICDAYFFSGNVCVGDVSVYKDGDFLTFKNTTYIANGLPSGEPSPTKTASYKKYKIGERGEVILVSEASWFYYAENNEYYVKKGNNPEEGRSLSSKGEVDSLIAEHEKGGYTLLYTVDFMSGEGVVYSDVVLTFAQAVEKVRSEPAQEAPEEDAPEEPTPQEPLKQENSPSAKASDTPAVGTNYLILIVLIVVLILIVTTALIIILIRDKRQHNPRQ